ncbi:MAG: MBL fold metallo-hydrolase [Desulfurococcales archaeon]|nr:MBL fold metallo-hydrolase [Desulfurococcales archaeon]
MIRIKWHGHSCFEIWGEKGEPRILLDPHDGGSIGLPRPKPEKPDVILVTHNHFDHNFYKPYAGKDTVVIKWKEGTYSIKGVTITGIRVPHDEAGGKIRGNVTAYKINYNGITLLHLGDLGTEKLPEETLDKLAGSNVVFIPVGGVYTIGPVAANRLLENIKPNVAVPMHFWITGMTLPIDPIDRFLEVTRFRRYRIDNNEFDLDKDKLPEPISIFLLKLR